VASKRPVFLREATGIVRAISPLQAFITTVAVTNIGFGIATTYLPALYVWPGANLALAFLLVLPFLFCHSAMYSMMAIAMPRSGGDYVWGSRILHPSIGSSLALTNVIFNSIFMGFFANTFVTYGLYAVFVTFGAITANSGLVTVSESVFTNPLWITVIGTVLIAYLTVIMIFGVRRYLKQQMVYWAIGMIGTLLALVLFLQSNPTQFAQAFNNVLSQYTTYQGVIQSANTAGFKWAPSMAATVGAVTLAWLANNGYQYSGYFSGELKEVQKSMFASTIGNNIVSTIMYSVFAFALVGAVGEGWLNSLSYIANAQPSSYTIPVPPNPYFFASLLTNNLAIATIINIGFLAWAVIIIPSNWMATTRIMLAMGFDRVLPTKLADVSDTYHTPVKSIIFVAAITWIGMVATNYYGAVAANMNYTVVYTLILAVVGLAGAVFPFARKTIYERSAIAKYKVAGIPVITILGIINFLFFIAISVAAGLNPFVGGPTTPAAIAAAAIVFVGSGLLYFVARAYHNRKEGIDIALNYQEVPPE
jgi:amino acid transporter